MPKEYVEHIDEDLEELIPRFMENTRREVSELREALEAGDYETVRRLGHSTKGAAYGYGFETMGEIGLKIEEASVGKNPGPIKVLLAELEEYLDNVTIIYEEQQAVGP